MSKKFIQSLCRHSFFLALLLHFLFLFTFLSIIPVVAEKEPKPPQDYVPAYTYTGSIAPSPSATSASTPPMPSAPSTQADNTVATHHSDAIALNKSSKKISMKKMTPQQMWGFHQSAWEMTQKSLAQNQIQSAMAEDSDEEPILLVGDPSSIADPFVKLLARSLSAHFSYPPTEGKLGIRGRALLTVTINPDGHFSHVVLVKSSDNENLDMAALYAANKAPAVKEANRFITKSKRLMIGYIFN